MATETPETHIPPPVRESKPDSDTELQGVARGLSGEDKITVRVTYRADRTGQIERSMAGGTKKQSFSWSLLSATSEQIKIEQETSDPPSLDRVTYRIDSPDRLTFADGIMKGTSIIRVK